MRLQSKEGLCEISDKRNYIFCDVTPWFCFIACVALRLLCQIKHTSVCIAFRWSDDYIYILFWLPPLKGTVELRNKSFSLLIHNTSPWSDFISFFPLVCSMKLLLWNTKGPGSKVKSPINKEEITFSCCQGPVLLKDWCSHIKSAPWKVLPKPHRCQLYMSFFSLSIMFHFQGMSSGIFTTWKLGFSLVFGQDILKPANLSFVIF